MERNRKEKTGSIYYDKKDKRWKCTYYVIDYKTKEEKRKYKSFIHIITNNNITITIVLICRKMW